MNNRSRERAATSSMGWTTEGDGHFDTVASASFALILSGLAADPKARAATETLKAAWRSTARGGARRLT
jgi:hypothetical protein